MTLSECCALAQDISHLPLTQLETAVQRAEFCSDWQFHPMQQLLLPQKLKSALADLGSGEILSVTDLFQIRFLFCRVGGVPLAAGPFCSEFFTHNDCAILLRRLGLQNFPPRELLARRGSLYVCPESDALRLVRCVARAMGEEPPLTVRRIDDTRARDAALQDITPRAAYGEVVRRRYRLEEQMLEAVSQGDASRALDCWRQLHDAVAFLKDLGQTLETARISAAITRTGIRMAAIQAGLPAVINDEISGASAARIRKARSVEEIDREHERFIEEYCQTIRRKQHSGYTNLVLSAVYYLERHFDQPVTVAALARELDVTPNYLTAQFKKEVGMAPLACLNQLRMRRAARQLARTKDPVQEIAASVGILDANYFVKRFKAEFGYTPTEFRRRYCV